MMAARNSDDDAALATLSFSARLATHAPMDALGSALRVVREGVSLVAWSLLLAPYFARNAFARWRAERGFTTVRYSERSERCVADVFHDGERAEGESGPLRPVLVFVHGGAWAVGSHTHHTLLGLALRRRAGAVVVLASYSLHPRSDAEAMVGDLGALLAWLSAHAGRFGGDPQRIALCGHSAGAHLCAMVVLRRALEEEEEEGVASEAAGWRLRQVRALIGLAGVYHIGDHFLHEDARGVALQSPMMPAMRGIPHFDAHSPTLLLLRLRRAASLAHLRVSLLHGSADTTVPAHSSRLFLRVLQRAARVRSAALRECKGWAHTDMVLPTIAASSRQQFREAVEFVARELAAAAAQDDPPDQRLEHDAAARLGAALREACEAEDLRAARAELALAASLNSLALGLRSAIQRLR